MSTQDCGETSSNKRGAFTLDSPPRFLLFFLAAAGAAEAAGFTLYAGRHNPSRLLMTLFLIWVLSPFVALAWAIRLLRRTISLLTTTTPTRTMLSLEEKGS